LPKGTKSKKDKLPGVSPELRTNNIKSLNKMKASDVLVRPVITEKVNLQMERSGRYTFVVGHSANKLEIKKAVESFYGVRVADVNTIVVPAKNKSRFTKAGLLTGRKPSYKKAVVTLAEGETIDLFTA